MSQLNKQEQSLIGAIGKDCRTPAEASAKLKEMFSGMLEKMLEAELDESIWATKSTAPRATAAGTAETVMAARR